MSTDPNTFLELYKEELIYARHHELMRSQVTNIVLFSATAITAAIGFDQKFSEADVPAGLLLFLLGIFGSLFSFKHFERFHFHYSRAREYRDTLDKELNLNLEEKRNRADKNVRNKFPRAHKWSLRYFWSGLPLISALLGIMIVVAAYY